MQENCPAMMYQPNVRVRMSVRELCEQKNKSKLNAFLRAWKRIKELPANDPNSFWVIAGYHGEPFSKVSSTEISADGKDRHWGGYCQHMNVLFPTWHRFYVLRLENALRSVCPDDDVTMAYWDETSEKTLQEGIPDLLTSEKVEIDGQECENPLRSFTLPKDIGFGHDDPGEADEYYRKPIGYTTVRYPFSGIQSPESAAEIANVHNKRVVEIIDHPVKALNENIRFWLKHPGSPDHKRDYKLFKECLDAPNYNAFSNIQSATYWSTRKHYKSVSLEQPHNDIHLAVGGFTYFTDDGKERKLPFIMNGSNGDMGENETAAFDPIFFFHHCFIDYVFWVWQKKNHCTDEFGIINDPDDPGITVSSTRGQGPSKGQDNGQKLGMNTNLDPFPGTSKDCINIEKQLGYTYTIGSLDNTGFQTPPPRKSPTFHSVVDFGDVKRILKDASKDPPSSIHFDITNVKNSQTEGLPEVFAGFEISGYYMEAKNIDSDKYPGSCVVKLYYQPEDEKYLIAQRGVLERWNPNVCRNCQFHRLVSVLFDLPFPWKNHPAVSHFDVKVEHFDPVDGQMHTKDLDEEGKHLNLYVQYKPDRPE